MISVVASSASTYTAPDISRLVTATVSGTAANGVAINTGTGTIGVEIRDLAALGANVNHGLIDTTTTQSDNHYGTTGFNSYLRDLASRYVLLTTDQNLPITI